MTGAFKCTSHAGTPRLPQPEPATAKPREHGLERPLAGRRRRGYTPRVRLQPLAGLALAALVAAAASGTPAPARRAPDYQPLDCGSLVPVPEGYRAAARPDPDDPDSETVVLFESGEAEAQLAAATPKDGRIVVEVVALSESERSNAKFAKRLEARLHKKAASRPGKIAVAAIKDAPYPAFSWREKDPNVVRVYLITPKRLVKVAAEFWSEAAAEVVSGYKDGP